MESIFYTPNQDEPFHPLEALSEAAGQPVRLEFDAASGYRVVLPDGSGPEEGSAWEAYSAEPQPGRDWVAAWRPTVVTPEPQPPVSPFEKAKTVLGQNEVTARGRITSLKARVSVAMIAFAGYTVESANAEGSAFVVDHAPAMSAFEYAGGNQVAATALYNDIAADGRDWLQQQMADGRAILALFADELLPSES